MSNPELLPAGEKKRPRFYYGYIILLASFLILILSWGAQYSFGVFFKPVLNEFGWSRAATSGAYSLNMVLTGIFGILAGRLSDRFGPRLVITVCGLFIGLGYLLMSRVEAIWQIYFFFGVLISIGMGGMFVPLISTAARWFVKRRGLASGIVVSGVGVGIVVMPLLANLLISTYNWRTSYVILGFITLVLIVFIAQFLRRDPEQRSLLAQDANSMKTNHPNLQVQGFSLRETIRTRPFWIICVLSFFFLFGQQAVMVHVVAHATDIGISAVAAAVILSIVGIISIPVKISMGGLGDRIGHRQAVSIILVVTTLSFLWLMFANELWMLYLFAVIFGLGYGGFSAVQSPLVADHFGLRAHGANFGLVAFSANVGGALGSLAAGKIFDVSGSYQWAFILCAILGVGGIILSLLLKTAHK